MCITDDDNVWSFGDGDYGKGDGLHLFKMGSKVFLILLAATAFDTLGVNFATIAF